jgi:hypothetical protein
MLDTISQGVKDGLTVKLKFCLKNKNCKPLDNIFLGNLSLAFSLSASSFEGFSSFSNDCVNWI